MDGGSHLTVSHFNLMRMFLNIIITLRFAPKIPILSLGGLLIWPAYWNKKKGRVALLYAGCNKW